MKIVFMGTPDYAVQTLKALVDARHNVAAVFCQPDKPVGRKQILTAPPVKVCAEELNIPVFQPLSLREEEPKNILRDINPDVIVVVAYGKLLPEDLLSMAKYGCVNGHASLLPEYRGASPIQWCIVCGEKKTGVTTMLMDKGMDTGDILEQTVVEIGENETAEELFEKLSTISADLMISTLQKLEKGEIVPQKQDEEKASYAPIIKKEMALIDFTKSAQTVHNAVRGYYSWPCAYFFLNGKRIKVISSAIGEKTNAQSGTVVDNVNDFAIACGDGVSIKITELQPEGSKRMTAKQFLNGNNVTIGSLVGDNNA